MLSCEFLFCECDSSDLRLRVGPSRRSADSVVGGLPVAGEALGCSEDGVKGRAVTDVVQQNELALRP